MYKKTKFLAAVVLLIASLSAAAEKIALINGTLINPSNSQISENATIIIDGGRVASVGDAKKVNVPKDAKVIDCKGKFILPGYIDAHDRSPFEGIRSSSSQFKQR